MILLGASPDPWHVCTSEGKGRGHALGPQVTETFSLDFVDANQRWQECRTAEIGSAVESCKTQVLKPISFERIFKADAMVDQSQYH